MGAAVETLIVLSDVHLGADLTPSEERGGKRSSDTDLELTRLLDHYRVSPPRRGRFRLVIAGDLIDFIGMVLPLDKAEVETEPSEEEREHGLGNARDHTVAKLRAVLERHHEVFDAFGRFVADGHAITIIHGNHDLELHWDDVREELTRDLIRRAHAYAQRAGRTLDDSALLERIDFSPWFFYRDGVVYIEHGHQYDPFCATEHLLAPLSPLDPRRMVRGFCDVLLRFVVRRTPGLTEHGHERMGIVDYLRFGRRLGLAGMAALACRFARAIYELFRLRRAHLGEAARAIRAQHEQALARFAHARGVGLERVSALTRLWVPPITRSISGIMTSLLLDRLALALFCVLALGGVAVASIFQPLALALALVLLPAWIAGHWVLSRRRIVDPSPVLAARARKIAALFRAPFIVMGHTHVPAHQRLGEHSTYINVGSWTEDDGGEAACAHLVIEVEGTRPRARLLRWDRALGPILFEARAQLAPSR